MANKQPDRKIEISGKVDGIGNVIGDHSSAHVEIHNNYSLFSVIKSGGDGTRMERDPRHTAISSTPFDPHPDASLPELKHLIGHNDKLARLLELYDRARREGNGAIVFITGQYGFGTKALGREFVNAIRRGGGLSAYTRFWPEDVEERTRRDPRWRDGFEKYAEVQEFAPELLDQPDNAPFWPLVFQVCDQVNWAAQANLPSSWREVPAFLRQFAHPGKPLVILLEDFEHAAPAWLDLMSYLAPELANDLPILYIASLHTEKRVDQIPAEQRTPYLALALELAQKDQAELYHLSRVTRADVAEYIGPAHADVAEHLHRLAGGLPILAQDLWDEWLRTEAVVKDDEDQWWLAPDSLLRTFGTGRDYIKNILQDLWPDEDESPWPADLMLDLLTLAAREGLTFTPEALAQACDVSLDDLVYGLEYLLDDPDDPGLVAEAEPISLSLPSANWQKTVERFAFSPHLVWTILRSESMQAARLEALAEGLRRVYWPFPEACARTMAHLYEQAGNLAKARECRNLVDAVDPLRALMTQAEMLLPGPHTDLSISRLWDVASGLYNGGIIYNHANWAKDFYGQMLPLAIDSTWQDFQSDILYFFGTVAINLGEYRLAREYLERALAMSEELGRKDEIAVNLSSLGVVAINLSEYGPAREYYQRALAMSEELGRKDGIAQNLSNLGDVAINLGEYGPARKYYQRALAISEELRQKSGIAASLSKLGDVAQVLGEYGPAREYLERALAMDEELGRKDRIAHYLSSLGNVARSLGEYGPALEYYQRALAMDEELGRKDGIAANLSSLGNVARSLGEYGSAREYLERALAMDEELGRKDRVAVNLSNLGDVARALGEYGSALEYYQRALAMDEELGRKDGTGVQLFGMGKVAHSSGEYSMARDYHQRALVIFEELGRKPDIAANLSSLGDVARALGEYGLALEYYQRSLAINEEFGRKDRIGVQLFDMGKVAHSSGEYSMARDYHQRALVIFEELGRKPDITANLSSLGDVARALGEYGPALEYYQRSLAINEELGRKDRIAVNLSSLGDVAINLGKYGQAREYLGRALAMDEELGHKNRIAANLSSLGNVSSSLGEYGLAREYLERSLAMSEELGLKDGIAANLSSLGNVARSLGEYGPALEYYQRALAMDEELGRKDGIGVQFFGMGKVAHSSGEYSMAREYYQRALVIFEELGRKPDITANLSSLGDVAQALGEYGPAREYYQRALALREETGQEYRAKTIREKLEQLDQQEALQ